MKFVLMLFLVLSSTYGGISQEYEIYVDSSGLPPHSLRAVASVSHADLDYMTIVIEQVVAYGRGTTTTPLDGQEITVKLPARDKPDNGSRIEVDLKEKIEVGAMPTSYIVLEFRTLD